jgi:RNA polymerase sigma-70 factor (ECF subfamily)
MQGLDYREIAELLGVPSGTVKSRIFRGRRRLRTKLAEYAAEMGFHPVHAAA